MEYNFFVSAGHKVQQSGVAMPYLKRKGRILSGQELLTHNCDDRVTAFFCLTIITVFLSLITLLLHFFGPTLVSSGQKNGWRKIMSETIITVIGASNSQRNSLM